MAESGAASPYRIYRNILLVVFRGGLVLLTGAFFVVGMALAAILVVPDYHAVRLTGLAAVAGIGLILGWLGIRMIGSRISASRDGLLIHRVLRRRAYVPWDQVTGIQLTPARRLRTNFAPDPVAIMVHRAGRRPLYCLGASFAEPSPAASQMLTSVQAEHQAWLAG